jgi:hypothetical protein
MKNTAQDGKKRPSSKVDPRVTSRVVGGYRTGKTEGLNLPAMMLPGYQIQR